MRYNLRAPFRGEDAKAGISGLFRRESRGKFQLKISPRPGHNMPDANFHRQALLEFCCGILGRVRLAESEAAWATNLV